jgi:hypothetical protein
LLLKKKTFNSWLFLQMSLAKIHVGLMQGEVMWHWKGLDLGTKRETWIEKKIFFDEKPARLNEQRKRNAQIGDKKVSEFPGAAAVLKREREGVVKRNMLVCV